MKKLLIATTIAFCLTAAYVPATHAGSYSDEPEQKKVEKTNEMIGFGSGAIAGAVVGGPIGALVGGIFGILIADDVNDSGQLDNAKQTIAKANHSLEQQQQNIIALQTDIHKMQHQQMIQLASYSEQSNDAWLNEIANFETNLQFKTASFLVEDIYKSQLNSLASILLSYPQLKVKVTGFADSRGDSQYNKSLSEQRAQAVKQYLVSNNVKPAQISISGEGETSIRLTKFSLNNNIEANANMNLVPENIEDLFFSRKVNISLVKPNQQMTAAN
ncbi:MAG: sortase system peptidoglycan-associated protein [Alphaproteobacteria bacterium]|jgi:sortase system peptidoglycan-associated protein